MTQTKECTCPFRLYPFSLLIDSADPNSPPFEDRTFYMAYEIRVGGNLIISYSQVAKFWGTDNFVGDLLSYGSAVLGVSLIFVHFLKRRQHAHP